MRKEYFYTTTVRWTGGRIAPESRVRGTGHIGLTLDLQDVIARYNPEDLLLAALSARHMLRYLQLCADRGIVVSDYVDTAIGSMQESDYGGGHFTNVELRPRVRISAGDIKVAAELHVLANRLSFIANSVRFPVGSRAIVQLASVGS
jgi:organic hydroperoxide reductase OsmC/OhrA